MNANYSIKHANVPGSTAALDVFPTLAFFFPPIQAFAKSLGDT